MAAAIWNSNSPIKSEFLNRIGKLTNYVFGNKFNDVNENVTRALSLYNFLLVNRNTPVHELRLRVLEKGHPIFSQSELEDIMKIIHRHAGLPFAKKILGMSGGAVVQTVVSKPEDDPSRSKFWDKFIKKLAHPLTSRIPKEFDGLLWYMFILYNLEQLDFVGPFISTALDSITLSLPVVADLIQEGTEKLLILAPIPYAGLAGEIIGYAISLVFLMFAIFVNLGRKHFGSAFKVSLEAIPIFGDVIAEASEKFEIASERYMQGRKRMIASFDKYSPHTANVIEYWSPSTNITTGPPVYWSSSEAKKNLVKKAVDELGLENAMSIMKAPSAPPADPEPVRSAEPVENLKSSSVSNSKKGGKRRKTRKLRK